MLRNDLSKVEYWNEFYQEEIQNYNDHKDQGEIWFGKINLKKIIGWIEKTNMINYESFILDIGTGNGVLLIELFKKGFINLYGLDYSVKSIILAESLAKDEDTNISYNHCDFLDFDNLQNKYKNILFDLCIDKGTFDAITVNKSKEEACIIFQDDKIDSYIYSLQNILKQEGLFFIISCNWTRKELLAIFDKTFRMIEDISASLFKFGSQLGNTITILIFKKL
ncbi:unnamed protein product [Gordionus sp. m RMFG-2023]